MERRSSARYEPSWPVIPVISATFLRSSVCSAPDDISIDFFTKIMKDAFPRWNCQKMKMKLTWFCCGSFLLRNILSIFLNIHFLKPSFHSRPFYKVLSTNSPRYKTFPFSILTPFCILTFFSINKKWFSHTSLFHVLDL